MKNHVWDKNEYYKKTEKKNKLERDRNSIKKLCFVVFISFLSTLVTKVICAWGQKNLKLMRR